MEKMAVDLNPPHPHSVASSGVLQILQYRDDSIDAWFKDGSRVALSGCATAFTHWRKVPSFQSQFQHEFGKQCSRTVWDKVHQYTEFAVSEYREKIAALVRFRNWFAERPFLCKSVVDTESIKATRSPIHYATWPKSQHSAHQYLTTTSSGCVRLQSTDGHAVLELAPHRQTFTASYLLPLPTPPTAASANDRHKNPAMEFYHAWTTELHSLTRVPDTWQHPVGMLLREADGSKLTATDSSDGDKENEPASAEVSVPLPLPLPLTCPRAHLHKLGPTEQFDTTVDCSAGRAVKVMFSEGIVYWLVPGPAPLCVEVLPTSSMTALLRSRDQAGRFFSCWTAQQDGKITEHVYFTEQPPPSSAHAQGYSLARVMGVASRTLRTISKIVGEDILTPCWKHPSPSSHSPSHMLTSVHVPGLGQFSAHSNGHVRVVFADRTTLDLFCPTLSPRPSKTLPLGGRVELEGDVCRLLLPNGRYQLVSTAHPMQHAGYVKVALDWRQWLCTPLEQRESFYQGTVYDVTRRRAVLAEVERIQRFDSILCGSSGGDKAAKDVAGVLAKTARAVREIDALLHK